LLVLVLDLTESLLIVSAAKISRAEDNAMAQPVPEEAAKMAGLSVRNGPLEDTSMDIDEPATNGTTKRKSRNSITKVNYKDDESSDEGAPMVSTS
jgi:DNA topoisomerase-1